MTTPSIPVCIDCRHLDPVDERDRRSCTSFPRAIPNIIWQQGNTHRKPIGNEARRDGKPILWEEVPVVDGLTNVPPTFGTERLERMLVDIANGTPAPPDQTDAERAMWRKLTEEVRAIRARGGEIDIPFESPGVD